jgi:hypothetical protein
MRWPNPHRPVQELETGSYRFRELPKHSGQLDPHEMVKTIAAGYEVPVLDVAHEVLREQGITVPEAKRDVDAATQALFLRTGEIANRAPNDCTLELEPEHEVGQDPGRGSSEEIVTIRADEIRDDMAARPVAAGELVVGVRLDRRPRVLEPAVQPLLPEEAEQVHPPDASDGATLRQEVRG